VDDDSVDADGDDSVEMKWAIAVSVVIVVVIVVAVVVSCFSKYARLFYKHDATSASAATGQLYISLHRMCRVTVYRAFARDPKSLTSR